MSHVLLAAAAFALATLLARFLRRGTRTVDGLTPGQSRCIAALREEGGIDRMVAEARRAGRLPDLMAQLVSLLLLHGHPATRSETADTMFEFRDGKLQPGKPVNRRVDDSAFKETLLYAIRDHVEADSPLLDRMKEAFDREPDRFTRMRIVRAIGTIGGGKACAICSEVARRDPDSPAGQEARSHLGA